MQLHVPNRYYNNVDIEDKIIYRFFFISGCYYLITNFLPKLAQLATTNNLTSSFTDGFSFNIYMSFAMALVANTVLRTYFNYKRTTAPAFVKLLNALTFFTISLTASSYYEYSFIFIILLMGSNYKLLKYLISKQYKV